VDERGSSTFKSSLSVFNLFGVCMDSDGQWKDILAELSSDSAEKFDATIYVVKVQDYDGTPHEIKIEVRKYTDTRYVARTSHKIETKDLATPYPPSGDGKTPEEALQKIVEGYNMYKDGEEKKFIRHPD
jgi:VCBS repeat-containing protein